MPSSSENSLDRIPVKEKKASRRSDSKRISESEIKLNSTDNQSIKKDIDKLDMQNISQNIG